MRGRSRRAARAPDFAPLHPGYWLLASSDFPLSEISSALVDIATPVLRKQSSPNISMEGRVGPIARARHQAVLHWVVMNVVRVPSKIGFVSNSVFPKPPLPDRILALLVPHGHFVPCGNAPREKTLDPPPATGEVGVVGGQGHDRMQVIRQHHDCVYRERAFAPGHAKGIAQRGDVLDERGRTAVCERDGEKESSTWSEVSSVPDHWPRLSPDFAPLHPGYDQTLRVDGDVTFP